MTYFNLIEEGDTELNQIQTMWKQKKKEAVHTHGPSSTGNKASWVRLSQQRLEALASAFLVLVETVLCVL